MVSWYECYDCLHGLQVKCRQAPAPHGGFQLGRSALLSCAAVGGSNYGQWCDKEYDALVVKAKRTNNQAERAKLYEKAQEVFHREAPWVPMAHSVVYQPMLKTVQGYRMSPFGAVQFFGVSLK